MELWTIKYSDRKDNYPMGILNISSLLYIHLIDRKNTIDLILQFNIKLECKNNTIGNKTFNNSIGLLLYIENLEKSILKLIGKTTFVSLLKYQETISLEKFCYSSQNLDRQAIEFTHKSGIVYTIKNIDLISEERKKYMIENKYLYYSDSGHYYKNFIEVKEMLYKSIEYNFNKSDIEKLM
jgi:hypothetical protein